MRIKLAVLSGDGKVGQIVTTLARNDARFTQVIPISKSSPSITSLLETADVLIDFSRPHVTLEALKAAQKLGVPYVIGTTGFTDEQWKEVESAAEKIPILHANNFAPGIQLLHAIIDQQKKAIKAYSVTLEETHHTHKKDTPSGTAIDLSDQFDNRPQIISHRDEGAIATHVLHLTSTDESVTITHVAKNRDLFAKGAIECAIWLFNKPPKKYTIQDYLENTHV
jgi:4-hydroxy-tetrahydrodipicolinate reductase